MADDLKPDTPSMAHQAMASDWELIRDVRAGQTVMRQKAEAREYLPKFADEPDEVYDARVAVTPFTAHYEDATRALAAKPFTKEVSLQGTGADKKAIPPEAKAWAEDVDLAGNNLHVFAMSAFEEAVHMGGGFFFVDFPKLGEDQRPRTLADERTMGLRPHVQWISIDDVLAVHDKVVAGQRRITSFRYRDDALETNGFEETKIERVRHIADDLEGVPGASVVMTVYDKVKDEWTLNSELSGPMDIPLIPVAPFILGRSEAGRYAARPTMLQVAHKQVEHFQHSGRIVAMFEHAAFPMLKFVGIDPPKDKDGNDVQVRVGPSATLFTGVVQGAAPGDIDYIEPAGHSLGKALDYLDKIEAAISAMALQPIVPTKGLQNVAATHSAINAARTHAVVQAWALHLKDTLEQVFVLMYLWLKKESPIEVSVNTDFSEDLLNDSDAKELREFRAALQISEDTLWDELKRRGFLGPQFDKEQERERLANDDGGMGMSFDQTAPVDPMANDQQVAA